MRSVFPNIHTLHFSANFLDGSLHRVATVDVAIPNTSPISRYRKPAGAQQQAFALGAANARIAFPSR